jgi:hypothetical protein
VKAFPESAARDTGDTGAQYPISGSAPEWFAPGR